MHWYQFTIHLNKVQPQKTSIVFPQDPQRNEIGKTVHNYVLQCGLHKQHSLDEQQEVCYLANNHYVDLTKLEVLQTKFASKGAQLIEVESRKENSVSREEFESLKKLSLEVEKELSFLEQEFKQLKLDL